METAGVNSFFLNRGESDLPTIIRLVFVGYAGGGTKALCIISISSGFDGRGGGVGRIWLNMALLIPLPGLV